MSNPGRVIDAICNQQWAITEPWLLTIIDIAERKQSDLQAVLATRGEQLVNTDQVTMRNGVAVLPVRGPIFRYANMFTQISGATSIDSLAADFGQAVANPAVVGIVLEVDSPGGMVAGVSEFAAQVRAATNAKPVVAYVSDTGASAAYWIASAASEIVISNTAQVGSIGVVMQAMREGDSGAVKFISSQSPHKQARPDSEAGQRLYQHHVDALAQVFIDSVAMYRGVTPQKVQSDFGSGHVLVGAAAVAAGMADRLGSLESIIAGLAGNPLARGPSMTSMPSMPRAFSEDTARAEFRASPSLQAEFKEEVYYITFMRAESAGRTRTLGAGRSSASSAADADAPGEPASAEEAQCRAEFESDATIRADFQTLSAYIAYAKAYHSGHIRIVGRRRDIQS